MVITWLKKIFSSKKAKRYTPHKVVRKRRKVTTKYHK